MGGLLVLVMLSAGPETVPFFLKNGAVILDFITNSLYSLFKLFKTFKS